jgi:DNA modification methylase
MKEFGWTNPVLIDEDGGIIAGHGRVMAAHVLGYSEVPVMVASGWSEAKKRAYIIADNKLSDNSSWNEEMLSLELTELADMGFDLSLTGFSLDELDELLDVDLDTDKDAESNEPEIPDLPVDPVTKLGDVWILEREDGTIHRVMCGDSTNPVDVAKLLDGESIDMVLTDPPYGISIVGKGGAGKVASSKAAKSGVYAPIAGDDSIDVAVKAIEIIKTLGAKVQIIWGGNYYAESLPNSSCWIVWDKQNSGDFSDAELAWTNQKTAVRIFAHMWNGMIKASERDEKRVHPTQKPVALADWCLEQYGDDCITVLDLFGGSGFTLLACEKSDRNAFIMEMSPHYVDVILQRYFKLTGRMAVLESTGEQFPMEQ